jgi:outer membrane receptor protein involved in Fe transport
VLTADDLSTTAALTLDDALRQAPGFSLFRRSGSRTANPTSQGVFLRGLGTSGASRAVVLSDGIPLNDPFGGWVYWDRVPRQAVGRVEVLRGSASELYGSDALGGVINFVPRRIEGTGLSLETSYGNERTSDASLLAGFRAGRWSADLAAEALHTDGYIIVDERERGRVDTPAGGTHSTLDLTLERVVSDRARLFARGSIFGEARRNGTPLQRNRTHIRQVTTGADWHFQRFGSLSVRVFGGPQVFDQDFSAVALDRNSETLTRVQRVPARQAGASIQWSRPAGSKQTLVLGLDRREVRGASDELGFLAGQPASAEGASGRQRTLGFFGEDVIRINPRWLLTAGARLDHWRNYDALLVTRPLSNPGATSAVSFADRTETAFSPRLSLLRKVTENISLTASAYRAFRAPTLNELYRSFRVGNTLTLSNSELRAERLTGGEAGASFAAFDKKLTTRGTLFWSEVARPIANVTLTVRPELITRRRENLGSTRFRGVELDATSRISSAVTVSGGYQFVDAAVLRFPPGTGLEGLRIPQVPRHQLTFQVRYLGPSRVTLGIQGRAVSAQFEDDQNRLRLDRYFTLDTLLARSLTGDVEVFFAAENLSNQRYAVGRTPVLTVGPPLLARFGVRFRLNLKR